MSTMSGRSASVDNLRRDLYSGLEHVGTSSNERLTTIKELFKVEIFLLNLFGGFIFENCKYKWNAIIRVVFAVAITIFEIRMRSKALTSFVDFDSASRQNIYMFSQVDVVMGVSSRMVGAYLSIKHVEVLYKLLNKRMCAVRCSCASSQLPTGPHYHSASRVEQIRALYSIVYIFIVVFVYTRGVIGDALIMRKQAEQESGTTDSFDLRRYIILALRQSSITAAKAPILAIIETTQFFGITIIALFMTVTMTDLMNSAASHVQWRKSYNLIFETSGTEGQKVVETCAAEVDNSSSATRLDRRNDWYIGHLRLTLEHIREALIMLRQIQNLCWLLLWLHSFAFVCVSCTYINACIVAGKQLQTVFSIFGSMLRSVSTVTLLMGYHWLHQDARSILTLVEDHLWYLKERSSIRERLLRSQPNGFNAGNGDKPSHCEDDHSSKRGLDTYREAELKRERVMNNGQDKVRIGEIYTIKRILQDIMLQWPSDWIRPDVSSYVSSTLLAIILVTTLHQLLEVANYTDLHGAL